MKQKKYSVTLIGLGNIGFLYDLDQYRKGFIKTHSKAINKHPNFKLLCGIEINRKKANKFKEVYQDVEYLKMGFLGQTEKIVGIAKVYGDKPFTFASSRIFVQKFKKNCLINEDKLALNKQF